MKNLRFFPSFQEYLDSFAVFQNVRVLIPRLRTEPQTIFCGSMVEIHCAIFWYLEDGGNSFSPKTLTPANHNTQLRIPEYSHINNHHRIIQTA
jgi:hypothetical protein